MSSLVSEASSSSGTHEKSQGLKPLSVAKMFTPRSKQASSLPVTPVAHSNSESTHDENKESEQESVVSTSYFEFYYGVKVTHLSYYNNHLTKLAILLCREKDLRNGYLARFLFQSITSLEV